MKAEFVTSTPNLELVIEKAARTCYRSEKLIKKGSAEKIFNTVIKQKGHESCAEHGSITMYLTIDRAVLAQLTRHRHFSFSVESQRYCNYSKDKFDKNVSFIKPLEIKEYTREYDIWVSSMAQSELHYFSLLEEGLKPEIARSVLPNSTKCELTITGNVRQWRNFFKLRGAGHAQAEIKLLSKLILDEMVANGIPKWFFDDIPFDY